MKKSIFFSLIFSILLIVGAWFAAPSFYISAAGDDALVQCGRLGGPLCDMCDLIALVKNVLDFIWKGAWVIAAGMMVYGGFYMILPSFGAGGAGMYQKGISILTNVAKGLVIVFFAWIVIDTIIKVVAGQSLTSGAPATLPQSTNTTTFNSQATPDLEDVPGPVTVPRFTFKLGPWNKISCTRAPDRPALALLEIPEEFKCKPGQPSAIPGFDPCDSVVKQNMEAMRNGQEGESLTTPRGASSAGSNCSTGILNNDCGAAIKKYVSGSNMIRFQSLILLESSGQMSAHGSKGEIGCSQIFPSTALTLAQQGSLPELRGKSPQEADRWLRIADNNIKAGYALYQSLLRHSKTRGDPVLAEAMYNGGAPAIEPSSRCPGQMAFQCEKNRGYLPTRNSRRVIDANIQAIQSGQCRPITN